MENLPLYISLIFGFTVLLAIILFYKASHYSTAFILSIITLIAIQSYLGIIGFYRVRNAIPPRLPLMIAPSIILLSLLFTTKKGQNFLDHLDIKLLTLFQSIRILVELVLYLLFIQKLIPEIMTFEGKNWDILSGISAPFIYYFGFIKRKISRFFILAWNLFCLILLGNIVFYSILSSPTPFQRYSFDQPNIALGYFPFILLPTIIVPMVLLSHLVSIRQLLKK